MIDYGYVTQRVKDFDERHGPRECDGNFYYYADGAYRECNSLGLLAEPERDPIQRRSVAVRFHELRLARLVKQFDDLKMKLKNHPDCYPCNEENISKLREMKSAVDIPVIASLNGVSKGKWIEYAERIESTGVDALELNLYQVPDDPDLDAKALEASYLDLVRNIRMAVSIPLALKLSPYFTSFPNIARHFVEAGANGLVLFNRFYQPDFDLENLEVVPNLQLSHVSEMRLPLRWTAMLYGRVNADFAMTSGIASGHDVIKALMAGAKVAAIASEFLRHGAPRVSEMLSEMTEWMDEYGYTSAEMMLGAMSQKSMHQSSAFERANYMKVLSSFNL